jgi:hypothetical protein
MWDQTPVWEGIEIDYGAGISPNGELHLHVGGRIHLSGANNDIDYYELKSASLGLER